MTGPQIPRTAPRLALDVPASIRVGMITNQVVLLDLSATGFRFRSMVRLGRDIDCTLRLPGFEPMKATLVWEREDYGGGRFSRALYPAVVESIARKYPSIVGWFVTPERNYRR